MNQIDVHSLAGSSKFNKLHGVVLFWCVLMLVLDGYDLAVVGAALPSIMKDMGVDATSAGVMAGSALFGMMLGAIFLGTLADRFGRPAMICFCVALFSLFTAAAGLTNDPITFSVTRFIAGLGIGGVLPIVTAQMAEFSPNALRTRLVTLVFAGYSIGGILVALTAKQLRRRNRRLHAALWLAVGIFCCRSAGTADSVCHEIEAALDGFPDQERTPR